MAEPAELKPVNQARQGVTGHNVRYVLIGGVALALIAMFLILGWHPAPLPK